ncbi:hypothetical protein BGY98DRAFT_1020782 [Russula aff. rugulosa BPL654]|nr:hypothetical protein BGY98DRAFT_1020782 [Russula aff. rugulosa BPL654]
MPLRRLLNTFCHHSNEDALMSDAITSSVDTPVFSAPLAPSRSRRRQEGQSSERASKRIAAMRSSTTTSTPVPASPAPTEIAYDISHDIEQSPEERIETLRAAGIKVRDFAYEPMPNSNKAPEVFDPNYGLLSPKALFRLIKMGWLTLADVRRYFNPYTYNKTIPTPSQRVRLRRQAGLATYPDDFPDTEFFGYNPTGHSDDEGEGDEGGPPPPTILPSAPGVAEAEAEAVVVEEPEPKRRKVKGTTKTRSRTKQKSLRRECSRPEV